MSFTEHAQHLNRVRSIETEQEETEKEENEKGNEKEHVNGWPRGWGPLVEGILVECSGICFLIDRHWDEV